MSEVTYESIHLDFTSYQKLDKTGLLTELTDTHQTIANLSVEISFLRAEEERSGGQMMEGAKALRREKEGIREAYIEKKWLLKALLDHA